MLGYSFSRFTLGFKMLSRFLGAIDQYIVRRIFLYSAPILLGAVAIAAAPAHADVAAPLAPVSQPELHLAVGPIMAGIHQHGGWDTQVGGELHLARLAGGRSLAALGGALGVTTFAEGDAIRLYLDFYVGLGLTRNWTMGIAAAPVLDLFTTHRPLVGGRVTAWLHSGVAPYLSASRVWGLGTTDTVDIAVGIRIPFSVARF